MSLWSNCTDSTPSTLTFSGTTYRCSLHPRCLSAITKRIKYNPRVRCAKIIITGRRLRGRVDVDRAHNIMSALTLTTARTQSSHCILRGLLLFHGVRLSYLDSVSLDVYHGRGEWTRTTRSTDFLDDSCNSPDIINSSKICAPTTPVNGPSSGIGGVHSPHTLSES